MSSGNPEKPLRLAYIGCWYKQDMYAHNCSDMVDSLRMANVKVEVVTSNCRCFSTAQRFAVPANELVNGNCQVVRLPHAPRNPGLKHGRTKYLAVKALRLDLWLATIRGVLFYKRAHRAEVIHFDQVLEAFGCIPLFVVIVFARLFRRPLTVTVHEIDPFQREHRWLNRLYQSCAEVFVYSGNMRKQLVEVGVEPAKIKVIRYSSLVPEMKARERKHYIYFGGHNILRGKGYAELLEALVQLKQLNIQISMLSYVGHGCNGLAEAKEMAKGMGVAEMIEWRDLWSGDELAQAYQQSKACLIPYTAGSARHPLTCALVNATPVIATRAVDIPEYLGDLGIYIDGTAKSITDAICACEKNAIDLFLIGARLRDKALAELDHRKNAREISAEYSRIAAEKMALRA